MVFKRTGKEKYTLYRVEKTIGERMAKRINNKVKPQFPLVSNNSNLNSVLFPMSKNIEIFYP